MAQPLPTCALITIALGALSVSIVVGHAATYSRVVSVTICVSMYHSKVHGYWAAADCFSVCLATGSASRAAFSNVWGSATNT